MSSDNQDSIIERVTINSDLIQHSEYDIEVPDNSDFTFAKDVNRLVIDPKFTQNVIAFKKNKDTLLTIPMKDIDNIVVTPNTEQGLKQKEMLPIKVTFRDNALQNLRSIIFVAKNKKYVNVIQQQLQILKDAEADPNIQREIITILNPSLCNKCIENKFIFEFDSNASKLCLSCFEKTYGKILLQTADKESAEYYGGHKDHVQGGFLAKPQSGSMYLTENYIIFAKQDKDISKRWQILIQLSSVILNWDTEQTERQKNIQWEGTSFNTFGFGYSFIRSSKKIDRLVVPYIDSNGNPQEPEFGIPDAQKWASELYRMSVKAKVNLSEQQNISEGDIVIQTDANCFNCGMQFRVYDLIICNHCITSFCDNCIKNHSTKKETDFESEYMGGHKLYPKSSDAKVHIFSDRIEVEALHLRIPYTSIINIENADEQKVSAKRMFLVGMYSFAWKKKDVYTIVEYIDGFNQKQALIFDFGKKIEEAQRKIYDRMLASRFMKERLLESQKKLDHNPKAIQPQTMGSDDTKHEINTTTLPLSGMSDMTKINKSNDLNPLNILKVRLAKGEITIDEYEEMRKMIES